MFHIIVKFMGIEIPIALPRRPRVGQIINLLVSGQTIPLIFDGTGFFHNRKVKGATIPQERTRARPRPVADPRPIPDWALKSTDPRVEYIIETLIDDGNATAEAFWARINEGSWKDALLFTGNAASEEDELAFRWLQLDAREAKRLRRALSNKTAKAVKSATRRPSIGKQDAAGEWLAALGQDDPVKPEDAVVFATDSAEMEALSNLVTSNSERDEGEWGVENPSVNWSMDVISELLTHAGKTKVNRKAEQKLKQAEEDLAALAKKHGDLIDASVWAEDFLYSNLHTLGKEDTEMVSGIHAIIAKAEAMEKEINAARQYVKMLRKQAGVDVDPDQMQKAPLATVLATLEAKRDMLTDKQLALVDSILRERKPEDKCRWANVIMPNGTREKREIMTRVSHINVLVRRADQLEWDIEQALDEYDLREADWDEIAHPRKEETPKVAVSFERQATYLDWVAKKAEKGDKPWFSDPAYIEVLSHAFDTNARTPDEASNRAYAAYRLRQPRNVRGYDPDMGFTVQLNGRGQQAVVTRADARVAMRHLPASARQHLNALARKAS
jgi:hypothetical protein